MIRKVGKNKYRVVSKSGKNLGTYKSRKAARNRLRQVEYFKHAEHKSKTNILAKLQRKNNGS